MLYGIRLQVVVELMTETLTLSENTVIIGQQVMPKVMGTMVIITISIVWAVFSRQAITIQLTGLLCDVLRSNLTNLCLIMESQQIYYTPKVEVLEMCQEGVLCGSNEIVDENIGEW